MHSEYVMSGLDLLHVIEQPNSWVQLLALSGKAAKQAVLWRVLVGALIESRIVVPGWISCPLSSCQCLCLRQGFTRMMRRAATTERSVSWNLWPPIRGVSRLASAVGHSVSLFALQPCPKFGSRHIPGLDYDRMFSPRDVQLHWCRKQIELAMRLGMPLFLHERDRDSSKGKPLGSAADLKKILQDCNVESKKVCIHCFTGPAEDLQEYIGKGHLEK